MGGSGQSNQFSIPLKAWENGENDAGLKMSSPRKSWQFDVIAL